MNYVYKVTIFHPKYGELYYVGMHTWMGEGLDPNYHGSCGYRYYRKWLKEFDIKEEILFSGTKEEVIAKEGLYIKDCLRSEGSFLRDLPGREYLKIYKRGRCLNCNSTETFNLNAITHAKGVETRRPYQRDIYLKGERSRNRSECSRKAWITVDHLGLKSERLTNLHSKEARKKAVATMKLRGKYNRSRETISKIFETRSRKARKVQLSDGFVGCVGDVIKHTGWKKGSVCAKFTEAFRKGRASLFGVELKPIFNVSVN